MADLDPNRWILSIARDYADTMQRLRLAATPADRHQLQGQLHSLSAAAKREFDLEHRWRESRVAHVLQQYAAQKGQPLTLTLNSSDAERVRLLAAIPPVCIVTEISGASMAALADMYEGWAQSSDIDPFNMVRCLGWADGMRLLVEAVGLDFEPPLKVTGEPDSLLMFVARRISTND